MATPNDQIKSVMDDLLLAISGVSTRKSFGSHAYYVEGKMFACVVGDTVIVKLPPTSLAHVMQRADTTPFKPGENRTMNGWAQIRRGDADSYRDDQPLFVEAYDYVAELARTEPAPKKKKGSS